MAMHTYQTDKRTIIFYDTREEIPGYNPANPAQVKEVPPGNDPMSGKYMVVSPFNPEPWVIKQPDQDFSHESLAWMMVYASGGHDGKERYQAREPGIFEAPNPSRAASWANHELKREADRFVGDITEDEVRAELTGLDVVRFRRAIQLFDNARYERLWYRHVLNRPSEGNPNVESTVLAVPQLPARDRNSRYSERVSIQRWEDFDTFLRSPQNVLMALERGSVFDGFCVDLRGMFHPAYIKLRNARNCGEGFGGHK